MPFSSRQQSRLAQFGIWGPECGIEPHFRAPDVKRSSHLSVCSVEMLPAKDRNPQYLPSPVGPWFELPLVGTDNEEHLIDRTPAHPGLISPCAT